MCCVYSAFDVHIYAESWLKHPQAKLVNCLLPQDGKDGDQAPSLRQRLWLEPSSVSPASQE